MADNKQFTPEQLGQMKAANAHGFIDVVTTVGLPNKEGKLQPVTAETALGLYAKAAAQSQAFAEKVAKVTETIRENLKPAAAPAAS